MRFPLSRGPWVLESRASPDQHVECLGEQAGVWGSLAQGFESWAYPFKLFEDWWLFVSSAREGSEDLSRYATRQFAMPHMSQVEYAGSGWRLTATWFVPRSLPAVMLLLDYEGARDLELTIRFRPSLAPMHLAAGGPLVSVWDQSRHELVISEPVRHLEIRLSAPFATAHRSRGAEHELLLMLPRRNGGQGHVPIVVSLGTPAQPDSRALIQQLSGGGTRKLIANASWHYGQVFARAPRVRTPDPAVNDALRWSAMSLDELRIKNPDLGYGLVSGYSASGGGTRPKYCWFFEEPTLTSRAYHWLGLSDQIREALVFLQRYQRADGKTAHEIVQSLPYWSQPSLRDTSRRYTAQPD